MLSEGQRKKELHGSIINCHIVYGRYYKAISSRAGVGKQESPVSTEKGSVTVTLPNLVTAGSNLQEALPQTKAGPIPDLSSLVLSQEHFL